jgi:formamidopyrimidine-DNA glycosylase
MPELPEVEIARRTLERWFVGQSVARAEASKTRIFRGAKPKVFEAIRGPLTRAERKGKYLLLTFGEQGVLAHLGMTGKFLKRPSAEEVPYSRARFVLESGEVIHFRDPRMFGRIEPAPAAKLWDLQVIKELGVDPILDGLTVPQLKAALGKSKQPLKIALMDQNRVTGLGNIHAAEALFRAKLNPARVPTSLTDAEWARLCDAIVAAIAFGLSEQEADEIQYVEEPGTANPFLVYGKAGEPCSVCGTVIRQSVQGGRSTYFCPGCQPAKRPPRAKKKPAQKTRSRR